MLTPPSIDETALLADLRAGHERAFETLVRAYGDRLLAVARRFGRDDADAQDIVQSAYLSAFRALDQFEGYEETVKLGKRALEDEEATVPAAMPDELVQAILAARA